MYKRILVPLDGSDVSEEVIPYVRVLAAGTRAEVHLLRVMEPPSPHLADPAHGLYSHQISASIASHAEDYLREAGRPLRHEGIKVSVTVDEGSPTSRIIAEADKDPEALVAMCTHGRSGPARWVMGSVTNKVLQGTENPLFIVRSHEGPAPGEAGLDTIIVPLDGSALSEQALPHAMGLAGPLKASIVLVRAAPSEGEYEQYLEQHYLGAGATAYFGPYEVFSKRANAEVADYLHQVTERLRHQGARRLDHELLYGRPADAIVEFAQRSPHSLVVMTTHGRSGIGRWVLGSVTDAVVRHSTSPVLVVRAMDTEEVKG